MPYSITDFITNFGSYSLFTSAYSPVCVTQIRLQCESELLKSRKINSLYSRPFNCFSRILKEEGWKAFFKGNFTKIIKYFPSQFAQMLFATNFSQWFQYDRQNKGKFKVFWQSLGAALAVSTFTMSIDYSFEFVQTRLINDINKKEYKGIADVYHKTIKTDGFFGLYRGFGIGFFVIFAYRCSFFGLQALNNLIFHDTSFFTKFLISLCCTIGAGYVAYPFDTIKRRVMMTCGTGEAYNGAFNYMRMTIQKEGIRPLFNGSGMVIFLGLLKALAFTGFGTMVGVNKTKTNG